MSQLITIDNLFLQIEKLIKEIKEQNYYKDNYLHFEYLNNDSSFWILEEKIEELSVILENFKLEII